ncbi:MAG: transporter substrate-binding domain-containing protein, partial [Mycobacterium sp.]
MTLSGCAKNTDSGSSTSAGPTNSTVAVAPQKVDDIAASVPEDIRKSGKLVVGVTIPYTPNEFKDTQGKIVGFDVDLVNAVAGVLGLTADYRESDFAKIIPSIEGGTYDIGMSSFTDTKEREQEVDFVTYFSAGTQWAQRAGAGIDPNSACGKKVSAMAASTQVTDELPAKSKACVDAGKPEIGIL